MGGCTSTPSDTVSKKAMFIISYDIDEGKNPELTFVMRFARENTNDNGEKLSLKSAEIIVRQFKIYVISVISQLVTIDSLNKDSPYITPTFMPPPLI